MRKSLLIALALVVACGDGSAEDRAKKAEAKRPDMDIDESGGYERIALYIGINQYEHSTVKSLKGCVNDMRNLRHVLKAQYRFERSMFRKDRAATRAGIREGLVWLMAQTDIAAKKGVEPTVVLAYAGHGGWRKALRKGQEVDGRDDTWIPSEGNAMGARDILDDDLGRIIKYLHGKGATVIEITDSCHSGTAHRGTDDALTRAVRDDDENVVFDPRPKDLFPKLPLMGANDDVRLVHLAACLDSQKAREGKDDSGLSCGRFTYALTHALKNNTGTMSWDELHRRVVETMAARWDGNSQSPKLSIYGGLETVPCFGADPLPPYISIKKDSQKEDRITINAGELDGIAVGMRIDFFAGLQAMREGKKLMLGGAPASGIVVDVDVGHSVVELERSDRVPLSAVAEMVDALVPGFTIATWGEIPQKAQAALDRLFAKKRIGRGTGTSFTVQVRWDKEADVLRLYNADRLPTPGRPDPSFLRLSYGDPEDLSADLLKLAKRRALLACRRNERYLKLSLAVDDKDVKELDRVDGVRRFRTGSDGKVHVKLTLQSSYEKTLQFFVFVFEEYTPKDGATRHECFLLHPLNSGETDVRIPADGKREQQGSVWPGKEPRNGNARRGTSRMRLKVLAVDTLVEAPYPHTQFKRLCEPYKAATRSASEDALLTFMEGLGEGGQRGGGSGDAVATFWATGILVFDITNE